jgi:hypothetical protein
VVLSSVGSQQSSGLGMITATHLLEEGVGDLPFPIAFSTALAAAETGPPSSNRLGAWTVPGVAPCAAATSSSRNKVQTPDVVANVRAVGTRGRPSLRRLMRNC